MFELACWKGLSTCFCITYVPYQLAKWILILEPIPEDLSLEDLKNLPLENQLWPTVISVAWKSKRQKIVKTSFGASLIGNKSARKQLTKSRQEFDLMNYHLFPRD